MDEDRIALVLARTSDLRSKIITCISGTCLPSSTVKKQGQKSDSEENPDEQQHDFDEESENLLNIKDALDSLESQLSSLQALNQQQWYEKEAALAEIEYSQKKLLKELNEYKGKDLKVIHEAIAFASETEDRNDLLLPPYPRRPSQSNSVLSEKNGYAFTSSRKIPLGKPAESNNRSGRSGSLWGPFESVAVLIGTAVKAGLTIVGVIAVLSLAGFEPRLKKRGINRIKISDLFKERLSECPKGKVAVIENGETRCVVKERVEIPFGSVVSSPDVSYGCG
ncbi:hypothetical protein ABFS83_02G027500 [Erythranthe nasuta]